MRPVVRGSCPDIKFATYEEARDPLIDQIDEYCSYCERRIPASLAVEHIRPKDPNPDLKLVWSNFLLACANCNSSKGTKDPTMDSVFWPDRDNTYRAFDYHDGVVKVRQGLMDEFREKAKATLELVGLNKRPGNSNKVSDRRWRQRLEAWNTAKDSLVDYSACQTDQMRKQIVRTAKGTGFWSIWMTVFASESDVCKMLISAFKGTSRDCFDDALVPIKRAGGLI